MPMPMRVLIVVSSLLLACACGGGGGGGDNDDAFSLQDLVGSWLGPTASVTVEGEAFQAAGPTGIDVDGAGNAVRTGASSGQGTVSLVSAIRGIYKFEGTGASAGSLAMLIMSADRNHLLWITNSLVLGAWQRNATTFLPPYADADIRNRLWTGTVASASAAMDPIAPQAIAFDVDALGEFSSDDASTNGAPLTVTEANKGEYRGDYITAEQMARIGNLVLLITPDKQFLALFGCESRGTFPGDCSFAALTQ